MLTKLIYLLTKFSRFHAPQARRELPTGAPPGPALHSAPGINPAPASRAADFAARAAARDVRKGTMNPVIRRRNTGRLERQALRRLREDAAGLLLERVPALTALSIEMHEAPDGDRSNDTCYTRRVVLEHASSLFEVRCSNTHCDEGVYDLTSDLLAALEAGLGRFEGGCACSGACSRVLRYVATATYAPRHEAAPPRALDGAQAPAAPGEPAPRPAARRAKQAA